ncbi:riboflavin biosynthesis protein [Novosphingobium marinum]|uniref:Riboflavin biosynthesis protein n=1 Tax=Novosphingobium marinum TaxID=1514948 RepID=A0A7Y9XW61_9SPHN|nr:bifunctional riboflavin kinase/FAD synthetase [Novosphingobium marinum]NYH95726.1 riboflavin kinase/FMN adenylyltransferase [Novosphingobium marinum]GGC29352.1 riboflavin biosynthesis protein [Novosphingobium marinum]
MIRLDHRDPLPPEYRGAIIALGNFDGFHLGHQAVVGEAIDWARREERPAIVATFDPHPVRYFAPDTAPFRLTTLDQRQDLFEAAGADAMLVFHFDAELASMPAEEWVSGMLEGDFDAAGLVTGEDFTFGNGRGGNPDRLRAWAADLGIETRKVAAVSDEAEPVSSTRIREALRAGNPQGAARLLTRPFAMRGTVRHGDKRGREIGYPTANLDLGSYLRPRFGIYAVTGKLPDGRVVQGAANIGVRPTFDPPRELLEPYLFDFSGDLYGQEIEVAFHHFIRPEAKFEGIDPLVAQMRKDCEDARKLLSATAT